MKDKVARWLKAGALLLTVVALSAALVACQGAVGPTGPTGADGTDGTDGTQGPKGDTGEPGATGISVLVALDSAKTEPRYVNNNDKDEIDVGELPEIDLSKEFQGGKSPLTYKITKPPHKKSTFTVTLSGNVVTVNVRSDTDFTAAEYDYAMPANANDPVTLFTVEAKDVDKFTATKTFAVLANRKPEVPASTWTLPKIDTTITSVGTQQLADSARDGGAKDTRNPDAAKKAFYCETFDTCVLVPDVGMIDGNSGDFRDDNYGEDNKLTYSVIPGRISTSATVIVVGGEDKITLTGLKSTWKPDKDGKGNGSHVPVVVKIEATDEGGLSVERDLEISVDEEPTAKEGLATSKTVKMDKDGIISSQIIVNSIVDFFENPEGDTLKITAKSSNKAVASFESTEKGNLKFKIKNTGNVDVIVTATDKLGQSVLHTIALSIVD